MNILDLDLDGDFQECFTRFGSHLSECDCGKEHFCIDGYGFDDYSTEEMQNIIERAKTDENMVMHREFDHVSVLELAGRRYVVGCDCEGWRPYMEFILRHRVHIKDFLITVADKAEIALEHEKTFNILKDKKFKVLDDSPF